MKLISLKLPAVRKQDGREEHHIQGKVRNETSYYSMHHLNLGRSGKHTEINKFTLPRWRARVLHSTLVPDFLGTFIQQ